MGDVFQRTFLETVFPGSGYSTGLLGIGSGFQDLDRFLDFLDFWIRSCSSDIGYGAKKAALCCSCNSLLIN